MVTKQQQLEWLAENHESWPYIGPVMIMSDKSIGVYYGAPMPGCHFVNFTEWQQERDKMSSKPEIDDSWHERGEFPPPETYCQFQKSGTEYGLVNCFVIGIDDLGFCVCRVDMDYHASMSASDFRPLRTEREKAVDEMISVTLAVINQDTQRQMFGMLYDAGYRKVNP